MDPDRSVTDVHDGSAMLWDTGYESGVESEYECLHCGVVVTRTTPGTCPTCNVVLRNCTMPIE